MKVSKLIHDLHEQVDELKIDNKNAHLYIDDLKKENMDLRKKQDQQLTNRQITILRNKQKQLEKDNFYLKGRVKNLSESV